MKEVVSDTPHVLFERQCVGVAYVARLLGFGHGYVVEGPSLFARPKLSLWPSTALIRRNT